MLVAFALFISLVHASPIDSHIRGEAPTVHATNIHPKMSHAVFSQSLDHMSSSSTTNFNQRYWVDSEFASGPEAPVIYHICGEGDVEEGYFLQDEALEWAKALGARVVFLEHRFYGKSLPFEDFSTEHLASLTLPNVLEDLAAFQNWISSAQGWTGKWIAVGGSYSGTLAALYRQAHPELVVGALASSAPMISGLGQQLSDESDASGDPTDSGRPWAYQACTSLGFWEAAGPDLTSVLMVPSSAYCALIFPGAPLVDSTAYNLAYDAPFLAPGGPSNILFTYGSDDVWTNLGLSTQQNLNSGITIRVIQGAQHHFDLNPPDTSDSQEVLAARAAFLQVARTWLDSERTEN